MNFSVPSGSFDNEILRQIPRNQSIQMPSKINSHQIYFENNNTVNFQIFGSSDMLSAGPVDDSDSIDGQTDIHRSLLVAVPAMEKGQESDTACLIAELREELAMRNNDLREMRIRTDELEDRNDLNFMALVACIVIIAGLLAAVKGIQVAVFARRLKSLSQS